MMLRLFLIAAAAFVGVFTVAEASDVARPSPDQTVMCPVDEMSAMPPGPTAAGCQPTHIRDLDPQNRALWLYTTIPLTDEMMVGTGPLGLTIMGKASRRVWVNGRSLGSDGAPGLTRETEVPGPMDSVHYIPRDLIADGDLDVALLMSGHHSLITLKHPMHWLGVATYQPPQEFLRRAHTLALASLGILFAAAIYFGTASALRRDRLGSAMLALLALVAGLQLLTEISRGLIAYKYPIHDLRLVIVALLSLGFGMTLLAFVHRQLGQERRWAMLIPVLGLTLIAMAVAPGFDSKALLGMVIPSGCALALAIWAAVHRRPHARRYAAALMLFVASALLTRARFLDTVFFLTTAGFFVFLVAQQALALRRAEAQAEENAQRAKRLEQAIAEANADKALHTIEVKSGHRTEAVPVGALIHCKGAGDYVELALRDGRHILASTTLAELEQQLPANFLRVHRSHIVNTTEVVSLTREPGGIGHLELKDETSVPVSRRIMPKVRAAM